MSNVYYTVKKDSQTREGIESLKKLMEIIAMAINRQKYDHRRFKR